MRSLICWALLYSVAIFYLPRVEETDFILKNILLFSFSVSMMRCLVTGRKGSLNERSVADCDEYLT